MVVKPRTSVNSTVSLARLRLPSTLSRDRCAISSTSSGGTYWPNSPVIWRLPRAFDEEAVGHVECEQREDHHEPEASGSTRLPYWNRPRR